MGMGGEGHFYGSRTVCVGGRKSPICGPKKTPQAPHATSSPRKKSPFPREALNPYTHAPSLFELASLRGPAAAAVAEYGCVQHGWEGREGWGKCIEIYCRSPSLRPALPGFPPPARPLLQLYDPIHFRRGGRVSAAEDCATDQGGGGCGK